MFYFVLFFFFFFFFWINRLCTLNSQKPSLELQSPKSQGFNFNWFSCCKHNPYPPLWTFFFFCMTYVNTKISVFFFFFFFQLLWHPIRFLSQHPKVHEKNPTTHHKPVLWFFFFNIATSCLYIPRVLAYSPHPTLAFILTKKNQQLLVHAPRCWYSSHIYSTSLQLSWFFNFFFLHSAQSNHIHTTMSLFQMGMNSLEVNDAKLTMAELELESLTSLFNK